MDLDWLPAVEDWATRIGAIERSGPDADAWSALTALARTRLDFLRISRLDRSLVRLFGTEPPPELASKPVRLAVLGSSTTSHLHAAIRVAGLRRGLWVQVFEPDYGQYRQALADPESALHRFSPTAVLFALDAPHLLAGADPALDADGAQTRLNETLDDLDRLWRTARERFGCQVLQQTVLPVFPPLLGLNEHRLPGAPAAMTARLNGCLRERADEARIDLLTLDTQVAQDGLASWHDPMLWTRAKQEVSPAAAPLYGELVARLLAAGQGRVSKCLVLDLDNTIWGGVIGDDGLDGIVLGQGSALGEAFSSFQAYAAALAKRGVILAVCSKNDEANALEAFDKHPEMILKRSDLSAFKANWNDKAKNLREIAATLNIGLDALVFFDDNPFERNLVRRELPMVAVPEVPDDPALYARRLSDAGYFEGLAITHEDRQRTAQYRANSERDALQADSSDLDAYLQSLEMRLVWKPFDAIGLQRITQLINKTNQFNLTTRRYAQEEVAALMADPRALGLQLRLTDRFGDNGVIAIVIGRLGEDGALALDTWLMSCRVLGRRVEEATLALVLEEAARLGATTLRGLYLPTTKNAMVAEHYDRLGFERLTNSAPEGARIYDLQVATAAAVALPLSIIRDQNGG